MQRESNINDINNPRKIIMGSMEASPVALDAVGAEEQDPKAFMYRRKSASRLPRELGVEGWLTPGERAYMKSKPDSVGHLIGRFIGYYYPGLKRSDRKGYLALARLLRVEVNNSNYDGELATGSIE